MDVLLLDFIFSFEGEAYTIDIIILVIINKFVIRYGYKMIEWWNKSDKYDILRKYWFQCDYDSKIKIRNFYSNVEK